MTTTDHLADALTALKTVPNCTALLRGQAMPANPVRLIVLDHLISTPDTTYERQDKDTSIQVGCWAKTYEAALALAEDAETALDGVGFCVGSQRPAPAEPTDTLKGVLTDFERST